MIFFFRSIAARIITIVAVPWSETYSGFHSYQQIDRIFFWLAVAWIDSGRNLQSAEQRCQGRYSRPVWLYVSLWQKHHARPSVQTTTIYTFRFFFLHCRASAKHSRSTTGDSKWTKLIECRIFTRTIPKRKQTNTQTKHNTNHHNNLHLQTKSTKKTIHWFGSKCRRGLWWSHTDSIYAGEIIKMTMKMITMIITIPIQSNVSNWQACSSTLQSVIRSFCDS